MAVTATYPNGILPWAPRVDNQDTVYAADPNQLAAEIVAMQGILGINPHIETSSPRSNGGQVVFSSVSARIHDAMMGYQHPGVSLFNPGPFHIPRGGNIEDDDDAATGFRNAYTVLVDDGGFYNGTDITIPANGWYLIHAYQAHGWCDSGHTQMNLLITGNGGQFVKTQDCWDWDFPDNKSGGSWGRRQKLMEAMFFGPLVAGQRLSVGSWNATSNASMLVAGAGLTALFLRG